MSNRISVAGYLRITVSALLVLGAAACSRAPEPTAVSTRSAAQKTDATRIAVQQAALTGLGADELERLGREALRNQRIYSPAGDNALEYYIALRNLSSAPDDTTTNALSDLLPYAVIGAEQAISRGDLPDAERLHQLIAAADPAAPSLDRIAAEIAEEKSAHEADARQAASAAAELEKLEPKIQSGPDAPAVLTLPTSGPAVAAATTPEPVRPWVPAVASAPALQDNASPTAPQTATAAPNSSPAFKPDQLVAIRTVQPAYPQEAPRYASVVSVKATFTVNADGSVGDVQLQGGGAAFARSVRAALRRWQFQPPGQSTVVTRQFDFSP